MPALLRIDVVMLFVAAFFSLFWLPHVVFADGNLASLGFDYARFMPKASSGRPAPVPLEIERLIVHVTGVFGACGMALNAMLCAFALLSDDIPSKKLALSCHLFGQALTTAVNYAKPPGTGVEGSAGSGPLPLILALMVISGFGLLLEHDAPPPPRPPQPLEVEPADVASAVKAAEGRLAPSAPAIKRVLSNENIPYDERLAVARVVQYSEGPGSLEAEKLETILKTQGYSWPIRKLALSVRLNMTFTIDEEGDLLYTSVVPGQGKQQIKCVNGASLTVQAIGAKIVLTMQWVPAVGAVGGSHLVLEQVTYCNGIESSRSTITKKYDRSTDLIISENKSVEGSYVRTFKRVLKTVAECAPLESSSPTRALR
ncbi:hypothetical protein Ctob_010857 [Chrysochromulina tobinii]|uniref:Uncharacterized protein n=1 Tax=Chrysochromulina tobinii TaxID=1460289 RepID=A0A0M0JJS3_9EUKA|nr:hypothetical protein Ctob_010857 [Chrysochromulina tobinii]|eukprot:KOO26851.1 hypothetical protein Ctob_010857 [Chrysochromulina sp. CCMP291]